MLWDNMVLIIFNIFIDDFRLLGFVYLFSHKSEAMDFLNVFLNLVENKRI